MAVVVGFMLKFSAASWAIPGSFANILPDYNSLAPSAQRLEPFSTSGVAQRAQRNQHDVFISSRGTNAWRPHSFQNSSTERNRKFFVLYIKNIKDLTHVGIREPARATTTSRFGIIHLGSETFKVSDFMRSTDALYLNATMGDLNVDDKVTFSVSATFERNASFRWLVNGRGFSEYSVLRNEDIPGFKRENTTFHRRVSLLQVEHLLKLPTDSGSYNITCVVRVDGDTTVVSRVLEPELTDDCPPARCGDRNALCNDSKCMCADPYPVKLRSAHTTCRSSSFIEKQWPCTYDDQCVYRAENSVCTNEGWCSCKQGYGRTSQGKCAELHGVGASCESDEACKPYGAVCVLNHCICRYLDVEKGERCLHPPIKPAPHKIPSSLSSRPHSVSTFLSVLILVELFALRLLLRRV